MEGNRQQNKKQPLGITTAQAQPFSQCEYSFTEAAAAGFQLCSSSNYQSTTTTQ
jgi:hypothetical protein